MNTHIANLLVADHVDSRIQGAANARVARELRRQRRDARRSLPRWRRLHGRATARA